MTTPLLELNGVHKYFSTGDNLAHVLQDIHLTIYSGEMVAIVGQSGSGKSTLMNILACLNMPSTGDYRIDGISTITLDSDALAELRRERFGFIFQRYQLLTALTASDNVAVPAIYAGVGQATRQQRATQLLAKLGLQERRHHYPSQLSGGQQQRVSIARALMNGGQIIFADEPTGALDSQSSRDVMAILTQLHQEGHTIILVTHDNQIAQTASRIIEIRDGRIISDTATQPAAIQPAATSNPQTTAPQVPTAKESTSFHRPPKRRAGWRWMLNGIKEAFRMARLTLLVNKMRTLLTMLGIIIGIASVVLIVALGNGSKQKVLKDISSVGTAKLMIIAGDQNSVRSDSPRVDSLTLDDMQVLAQQSYITAASPELSANMTAQVGNISRSVQVEGASLSHANLQNIELVAGRLFRPDDLSEQQQTVVIEQKVRTAFFPHQSAVGQVLLIGGIPCRVIGVFKVKGYDDNPNALRLWLPYTTLQTRFVGQSPRLDGINVGIRQGYASALAVESVTRLLTARHGNKDFTIINSDSITQAVEKTAKSLTLLVSAIAVISLLVGGIGVMNIMLVSVTERTGEIGVRMAVGASYRDIVQQFLIEAMLVCSVGGILGVVLAFGLGALLQLANIDVAFSTTAVVAAVLCSTLIGLLFGFMPAHRAANMNPIDALNQG